jgi:putative ABC transport system permease protein
VGLRALTAGFPDALPRMGTITISGSVLLFTSVAALLTGLGFGAAPLLRLTPSMTAAVLKQAGQRTTHGRHRAQHALAIIDVSLAVALVLGAGLVLRTVQNLSRVDAGFDRAQLVTFAVSLPAAAYNSPESRSSFYQRLMEQLRGTPGVLSVAAMDGLPPLRNVNAFTTDIEGFVGRPNGPSNTIDYYQQVTADYFDTMRIPVLEGRSFSPSDGGLVAIVNRAMARSLWPGQSALGRRVRSGTGERWSTIVGVVADVKQGGVDQKAGTELYFPASGGSFPNTMNVVLRTPLRAGALTGTIQRTVASIDPSLPIINLRTMQEVFDEAIGRPRLLAQLLTTFAALACCSPRSGPTLCCRIWSRSAGVKLASVWRSARPRGRCSAW